MSDEPFVQKGPEPLTRRIDIRLSANQRERLRGAAEARGISSSEYVRVLIDGLETKEILGSRIKTLKEELFKTEMKLAVVTTKEARREEERKREELEEAVQRMKGAFESSDFSGIPRLYWKASPEVRAYFRGWLASQSGDAAVNILYAFRKGEQNKKERQAAATETSLSEDDG